MLKYKKGALTYFKAFLIVVFCSSSFLVYSQDQPPTPKTKFVFGIGLPELIHAGIGYDLTTYNQVGFSAGIVPSGGTIIAAVSAEHRFYFGKLHPATFKRQWFLRQGFSYHTDREEGGLLSFTIGKDISKVVKSGWTIDAGIQIPIPKESSDRSVYAALRIQRYIFL